MDKEEIKEFFRWLESASTEEVQNEHQRLTLVLDATQTREGRTEVYFRLRHIEEHLLAEIEVSATSEYEKLQAARDLLRSARDWRSRRLINKFLERTEKQLILRRK